MYRNEYKILPLVINFLLNKAENMCHKLPVLNMYSYSFALPSYVNNLGSPYYYDFHLLLWYVSKPKEAS